MLNKKMSPLGLENPSQSQEDSSKELQQENMELKKQLKELEAQETKNILLHNSGEMQYQILVALTNLNKSVSEGLKSIAQQIFEGNKVQGGEENDDDEDDEE